jgi:hypothetical protein
MIVDPDAGTAEMTVVRDVWGELHIVDEDMVEYVKDFHHTGLRYANFLKDEDWEPPAGGSDHEGGSRPMRHGPWELVEVSGFLAHSDTVTVAIDLVRVQGDGVDVTIDDPLDLIAVPDGIMQFTEGETVTVTVSGPADGSIVYLHTRHSKTALLPVGGGEYSATVTAGRPGRYNLWVQVIAHDTIFDSEYPEDALIWGVPYVVAGEELERY